MSNLLHHRHCPTHTVTINSLGAHGNLCGKYYSLSHFTDEKTKELVQDYTASKGQNLELN